MADATQVQRRKGTEAQCNAMTPADAEIIVDQTNDTLRVGDGSRQGGFIMPNAFNIQQSKFTFAVAAGTANAITLDIPYLPSVLAQPFTCRFKASLTNSGAMTASIGPLGPFNLRKVSEGSIVALTGGEVISGCFYDLVYDGSNLILMNVAASSTRMVIYPSTAFSGFGFTVSSIPSWAKRVTVSAFAPINATSILCNMNSETGGYNSSGNSTVFDSGGTATNNVRVSGFPVAQFSLAVGLGIPFGSAAFKAVFEKISPSDNLWSIDFSLGAERNVSKVTGQKLLSSSLSSVEFSFGGTASGTYYMMAEG